MLTIAVPKSMKTTVDHLKRAGRPVFFEKDRDFGTTSSGDEVVRLRSYDIPLVVGLTAHVGICGSDVIEERKHHFTKKPEILAEFGYGRQYLAKLPTLDLVARAAEYVPLISDIPSGSLILTELPHLTREKFEETGRHVQEFLQDGPEDLDEFIRSCERSESVGLVIVHGRIPAILEHLNGYKVFGVMVNESGGTLKTNGLRVIERLQKIKVQVIADVEALEDTHIRSEIDFLVKDMIEAERIRTNPESEANPPFSKERGH